MPSLADELGLEPPRFLSRKCLHKISAFLLYNFFLLLFFNHWSQSAQSKPVLKLLQSSCWTRCIFNTVRAGRTHQIFVSFPVKQHSAYTGWMTQCPHVPSWKVPLRRMDAADILRRPSSVTESHWWRSTIHQALRRKKLWATEWTFKMMNVCSRLT